MSLIKYHSEIQFLSCMIWHSVNETDTGNGKGVACSLFARFSVSVGLELSKKFQFPVLGQFPFNLQNADLQNAK